MSIPWLVENNIAFALLKILVVNAKYRCSSHNRYNKLVYCLVTKLTFHLHSDSYAIIVSVVSYSILNHFSVECLLPALVSVFSNEFLLLVPVLPSHPCKWMPTVMSQVSHCLLLPCGSDMYCPFSCVQADQI